MHIIKPTFDATTQYVRDPTSTLLKRNSRPPFSALNVYYRKKVVVTDPIYSDVPTFTSGAIFFKIMARNLLCVTCLEWKQPIFLNTLEDTIHQRGAMYNLLSDSKHVEIKGRVKDILRASVIENWSSEAYQQQQKSAERKYHHFTCTTNRMLERTGSPYSTWLSAIIYICYLLNHTASP